MPPNINDNNISQLCNHQQDALDNNNPITQLST